VRGVQGLCIADSARRDWMPPRGLWIPRGLARAERLDFFVPMSQETGGKAGGLTLVLGGVRAGKSARALALAAAWAREGGVLFVATAEGLDDEMRRRIAAHRRGRPAEWETIESPLDPGGDIERRLSRDEGGTPIGVVVIDCLTLWVSNLLLALGDTGEAEAIIAERAAGLLGVVARHRDQCWIMVSNEVGFGVVPPTALGRRYRDALGRVNQLVAEAAREVTLMVAGLSITLKGAGE
jgi:adenosyl cobinamide kinase/adenosyl cobinamide phosphate guanylyltransferase